MFISTKMSDLLEKCNKFNHYLIEIFSVDEEIFRSKNKIVEKTELLIKNLNLKVVDSVFFEYFPYGITLTFILSSSHISIHTWPEYNYLHIDLFCCSDIKDSEGIKLIVKDIFDPKEIRIKKIKYE